MKRLNYIDIHTHKKSQSSVKIYNIHANLPEYIEDDQDFYFSIGLHPWFIDDNYEEFLEALPNLLSDKVIAIGETGIDKSILLSVDLQEYIFRKHIELSEKRNLPLIIHCVKAYSEIIKIIKTSKKKQSWIFHAYNQNVQIAKKLLQNNCYFSFGKLLFNEKSKAYKSFSHIPLRNIFLETDESNFSIEEVYEKAASIRKITVNELKKIINTNFNNVFQNISSTLFYLAQ